MCRTRRVALTTVTTYSLLSTEGQKRKHTLQDSLRRSKKGKTVDGDVRCVLCKCKELPDLALREGGPFKTIGII